MCHEMPVENDDLPSSDNTRPCDVLERDFFGVTLAVLQQTKLARCCQLAQTYFSAHGVGEALSCQPMILKWSFSSANRKKRNLLLKIWQGLPNVKSFEKCVHATIEHWSEFQPCFFKAV